MAQYLAEVMARADAAEQADKPAAQRLVFETILKLWRGRAGFPEQGRPYHRTGMLAEELERLFDLHGSPYFWPRERPIPDDAEVWERPAREWIRAAVQVSRAAHQLVVYSLTQATLAAAGRDGEWARDVTAQRLDDGDDAQLARLLAQITELEGGEQETGSGEVRLALVQALLDAAERVQTLAAGKAGGEDAKEPGT